jgi:hypothetical protein
MNPCSQIIQQHGVFEKNRCAQSILQFIHFIAGEMCVNDEVTCGSKYLNVSCTKHSMSCKVCFISPKGIRKLHFLFFYIVSNSSTCYDIHKNK